MRPSLLRTAALLAFALFAGASCVTEPPTAPLPAPTAGLRLPLAAPGTPSLLGCEPAAAPQTVSSVIGLLGGTLEVGGNRVVIPEKAVLVPTTFTLTVPRSPLVEISVRAGDAEHYVFQLPVVVTIDYGRCASALVGLRPVTAWHIDESSKRLLENMGGVDLRAFTSITFVTNHLSGYAVAD